MFRYNLIRQIILVTSALFLLTGFADCGQVYSRFKYKINDCARGEKLKLPTADISKDNFVIYRKKQYEKCPAATEFAVHYNRGEGLRKEIIYPLYAAFSKDNSCELNVIVTLGAVGKKLNEGLVEAAKPGADTYAKNIFNDSKYKVEIPAIETTTTNDESELKNWCNQISGSDSP
jgi:hypothetical protein